MEDEPLGEGAAVVRQGAHDARDEPLGLAAAGPVSQVIGVNRTLWLGVAMIIVPTAAVLFVPEVRNLRSSHRAGEVTPLDERVTFASP